MALLVAAAQLFNLQVPQAAGLRRAHDLPIGVEGRRFLGAPVEVEVGRHLDAGMAIARTIRPLDVTGAPSDAGTIVMISIGMSNTSQEFCSMNGVEDFRQDDCRPWTFGGRVEADPTVRRRPEFIVVNGARGGMSAEYWVTPPVSHVVPVNSRCLPGGWSNPANAAVYPPTAAGDDLKRTNLGTDLRRLRLVIVAGAALAIGAATSVAGAISFVGLVVPHLMRRFAGHEPSRSQDDLRR